MHLMWKILINYFLKIGSVLGIVQFNYDEASFIANKSRAKRIYSVCVNTTLVIAFPTSACILYALSLKTLVDSTNSASLMKLAYIYDVTTQISTYTVIVWILIYGSSSKMIDLVNTGNELIQNSAGSFSSRFFWLIILKSIFFEWIRGYFGVLAYTAYLEYGLNRIWMLIVTNLGIFVNMFVGNVFFCGIYSAGKLFKGLNKQLKLIVKPLKTNQKLSYSQLIEISDQIDRKMILHAKIGKFVEDINQTFSLICLLMLIEAFVTITEELYSFYAASRTVSLETSSLSVIMAFFQALNIFSFVYASSHVAEQTEKTGDILKVFVDSSADDRLKNSVSSYLAYGIT